uniref:Uncharacterized protein n=1 Tax=Peronospora matthiolae TaxID=2874970 RepID=A0AAV1UD20_9STRA
MIGVQVKQPPSLSLVKPLQESCVHAAPTSSSHGSWLASGRFMPR